MIEREFPYTNLHDLNIDWILKIIKDFQERYQNLDETFQNMLQQIITAGNNAIEAINNNEETALEAIRVFEEQCIQALDDETTGKIAEIQNVTHNQIDAINAAGNNAIELIDQDATSTLNAISSAGTTQVNIINGLITSLPQTYEDAVNQLQIINSVLNQTYNYPPLVQGHYADANESDSKTLVTDNYRVSTLLSTGCASRKIKIQITGASGIIREIIYWTGWGTQAIAHGVSVSTSSSDEKTVYEYTFPATATYFTIVFCSDYNMLTQFLVSDLQVSFEWKTPLTDMVYDLNRATKNIPYCDNSKVGIASKTGTTIFVTEKNPRNFSTLPLGTVVKGRNRFNITSATFSFSGYSSSNTLTKQNNGIKNVCTQTSTSTSTYCYTEYTAEYTGNLFFSCEGKVDGNVRDLRVSASINGTDQEILWGEGPMFMVLPVTAGDTVRLKFYVHAQTDAGSTVYYSNIMLAYGGLYPFEPYQSDLGYCVTDVMKEISLSSYISSGTSHSTSSKYNVTISGLLSDLYALPSANTVKANGVYAEPENLGIITASYNSVYNAGASTSTISRGIGVNTSGDLVVYIDGKGKADMTTWLNSNPVKIKYKIGQTSDYVMVDTFQIQEGMIIVLPESGTVSYDYFIEPRTKIVCFGDSITGIYNNKANYPEIITYTSNIDAVNVGFSGLTYTDHGTTGRRPFSLNRLIDAVVSGDYSTQNASEYVDPESPNYTPLYAEHLANLEAVVWSSVRYVSFFYGTNDYTAGAYLNSEDDPSQSNKQRTNIEDAVKYCVSQLLTKYPHLTIIILTPYWMTFSGQSSDEHLNNKGKYLYEYDEVIENVAKSYNTPVLNLYHRFGINSITKWYFEKDDAHPTDRLKRIIAKNIIDTVKMN